MNCDRERALNMSDFKKKIMVKKKKKLLMMLMKTN